jgi:hypothetical protein
MLKQSRRIASAVLAVCLLPTLIPGAAVELKHRGDRIEITIGGRTFPTYYFGQEASKAYLMPIQTAKGLVISGHFRSETTYRSEILRLLPLSSINARSIPLMAISTA